MWNFLNRINTGTAMVLITITVVAVSVMSSLYGTFEWSSITPLKVLMWVSLTALAVAFINSAWKSRKENSPTAVLLFKGMRLLLVLIGLAYLAVGVDLTEKVIIKGQTELQQTVQKAILGKTAGPKAGPNDPVHETAEDELQGLDALKLQGKGGIVPPTEEEAKPAPRKPLELSKWLWNEHTAKTQWGLAGVLALIIFLWKRSKRVPPSTSPRGPGTVPLPRQPNVFEDGLVSLLIAVVVSLSVLAVVDWGGDDDIGSSPKTLATTKATSQTATNGCLSFAEINKAQSGGEWDFLGRVVEGIVDGARGGQRPRNIDLEPGKDACFLVRNTDVPGGVVMFVNREGGDIHCNLAPAKEQPAGESLFTGSNRWQVSNFLLKDKHRLGLSGWRFVPNNHGRGRDSGFVSGFDHGITEVKVLCRAWGYNPPARTATTATRPVKSDRPVSAPSANIVTVPLVNACEGRFATLTDCKKVTFTGDSFYQRTAKKGQCIGYTPKSLVKMENDGSDTYFFTGRRNGAVVHFFDLAVGESFENFTCGR